MFLAVRPQAVREPRCDEKKERWLLAAVLPAPYRHSLHWLDFFHGGHHSILAVNCFKTMTVTRWQLGLSLVSGLTLGFYEAVLDLRDASRPGALRSVARC